MLVVLSPFLPRNDCNIIEGQCQELRAPPCPSVCFTA